jgi:hypothetical protein
MTEREKDQIYMRFGLLMDYLSQFFLSRLGKELTW